MYSKVKILGHPIHPMLVAFPVTLYAVTLVSFIVAAAQVSPFWFRIGVYANIAGVIMAAVAALPGFIDWLAIPATHPARSTGFKHLVCNVVALVLFLVNAILAGRRLNGPLPYGVAIMLPALGLLATLAAGWLGWKLVQTHHVGVILTPDQQRYEPIVRARPLAPPHTPTPTPGPRGPLPVR